MSKNPLIKYFLVLKDTTVYHLDDMNRVALPESSKKGKKFMIRADQHVKSFGQQGRYKTNEGKVDMLILVNGNGVKMDDVKLYADNVDDCGCDGNPVAKPTDMEKLDGPAVHKSLDKESAFIGKKPTSFDKSGVFGFFLGAAVGAGLVWFQTKDKKKTAIAAVIGAVIGMIIGYFIGKRGEKKVDSVSDLSDIEQEVDTTEVAPVENSRKQDQADDKEFLQLGESYDFSLPNSVYAMTYGKGAFYIAKDKSGNRNTLSMGTRLKGKLVEVKDPQFFIPDAKSGKVVKIQSKKPLPFLDLGNKVYIPLAVVDPASMITTQEAMDYLTGQSQLDQEIYVKGRYAGKKVFNIMYMPSHDTAIRSQFGKRVK